MTANLAQRIDSYRAAYRAFVEAVDRDEQQETPATKEAYSVTDKAEIRALIAVCAYRCRTLDEAREKAEYLLTTPSLLKGDMTDHEAALLRSFTRKVAA